MKPDEFVVVVVVVVAAPATTEVLSLIKHLSVARGRSVVRPPPSVVATN